MSSNTIKIKAGSGTPTTSDIQDKELAFDRSADKLYINDAGTIVDLTGSASSGDIEGVTAGTGLSGGGTSGTVTLNIDSTVATLTGSQTLTNKTLTSPTITGDISFNDASTPKLTITDTTNTVSAELRANDTTGTVGTVTDHNFNIIRNGTGKLTFYDAYTMHNNGGNDLDFRAKDDSGTEIFRIDAGTSKIHINSTLLLDSVNISAIQSSGESFADNDTSLMTSAAINDRITSFNYLTAHPNISAASSSDNSGRTYIQDITVDSNGHVTGIATATETVTDTNTTYSAGTGLDLSGTTFSVDVSDFMTNGVNNRVLTATGTDGINAESSLTFSGTQLTNTGDIKIASGSLGVNTNPPSGDGRIRATSYITAGYGNGGVALTHNDGYGNANVTFNHEAGTPEQNGQSARIEVNTDATSSEALMSFETSASDVTSGSAQGLTESFKIAHDYIEMPKRLRHMGDTDTYIQYDADRIYLVAGGTTKYDSNNGNVIATGDILDENDMASNSDTAVASQQSIKAYVDAEVAGIVNSAPAALNTLDELAAALGDDENFATTTSNQLGNRLRVDTASQGLTGTQQANAITNLGITATKAELNYVDGVTSAIQTQLDAKLTSSSSLNGSNISSGTVAAARIANLAASKITSGTFDAARIAHNSFDIGDTTAETGRSVHETGIYTFNRNNGTLGTGTASGYYSVLAFGQGLGGSAQIGAQWYSGTPNLYFRTLRDTTDDWQDWQRILTVSDEGSGNGLDADTLDGVQGSSFLRSDATDTASGVITFSNRVTSSATGGFTIGNYAGYDRIQNASNSFSFLTDGNGYADMTFGTVTAGTWNGSVIASAYLDSDTAHLSGTQTFSGTKTFSDSVRITGGTKYLYLDNDDESLAGIWFRDNQDQGGQYAKIFFNSGGSNPLSFYVKSSTAVLQLASSTATVTGNIAVSGTVDGRDVASDGSKLDGIESGATADQSASEILTAIKTVDGSGTGLDADLLDGSHASAFATLSGSQTFTGIKTFTEALYMNASDNTEKIFFQWNGTTVGDIGGQDTTWLRINQSTAKNIYTPRYIRADGGFFIDGSSLGINGTGTLRAENGSAGTPSISFSSDTNTGFYRQAAEHIGVSLAGAEEFRFDQNGSNGDFHATGDVVAYSTTPSDSKLKKNVKDIEYGLDAVMKLNPKEYDWKKDDRHDIGFIAQEVEEVIPEVVKDKKWFDDKVKTLDYEKLTAVLIKAVQELKAEVEELKK